MEIKTLGKKGYMRRSGIIICILFLIAHSSAGQTEPVPDSLPQLQEVVVHGYSSHQPLLETPASVGIIYKRQLQQYSGQSLLPSINHIPGVRMEERSPGSYRLSIRGSLLRSPFGVRNVKVYIDEFPFTDASGNTYLNLIDAKSVERVEILKGPDGSLFGANSGGVVLFNLNGYQKDSNAIVLGLAGGSYGLFHENASLKSASKRLQFSLNQGWQRSDGYRQQSAMQRHFIQASQRWSYGERNNIRILALYADLQYETPGGLTKVQYDANPRQARPAGGPNPGAVEQQAGIYNKTFFGGISNEFYLTDNIRHVISFFGTNTNFENPFITNYEVRNEKNLGVRTYIEFIDIANQEIDWKWSLGLEGQQANNNITNYENNLGSPGLQIAFDEFRIHQLFYFTRLTSTFFDKLTAEVAVSLNKYQFSNAQWATDDLRFDDQWMPRFALSYLVRPDFALRASLSRGYSPPTLAEIRPSGIVINQELQPESGWSTEGGFRLSAWNNRVEVDASIFRFNLTDAIVRREYQDGTEYFVNAGGTKQTGIETFVSAWIISPQNSGLLRSVHLITSFTYNYFLFDQYSDAIADYSGNRITGVPQQVFATGLTVYFPLHINMHAAWYSSGKIPLNDANDVYADAYQVLGTKLSWVKLTSEWMAISVFAGADNITDAKYSRGNDINAFGGRYFNAAPPFNFYVGVNLRY